MHFDHLVNQDSDHFNADLDHLDADSEHFDADSDNFDTDSDHFVRIRIILIRIRILGVERITLIVLCFTTLPFRCSLNILLQWACLGCDGRVYCVVGVSRM